MGFDVADQRTKKLPETRYYCSSDVMGRLIDMNTRQVGLGIEDAPDLWVSKMHNAYKTTNLTDLPVGVQLFWEAMFPLKASTR